MPSGEEPRGRQVPPENPPQEQPFPYRRVVRFESEPLSAQVYHQTQEAIFLESNCSLSSFRLEPPPERPSEWYIAVIGEQPDEVLDEKLRRILEPGESEELPEHVMQQLVERRRLALQSGQPWVENHRRKMRGQGRN